MMKHPAPSRARKYIYALGYFFVVLALALHLVPALAEVTNPNASRICALIGAFFLAIAHFGSERLIQRCESLFTGWP